MLAELNSVFFDADEFGAVATTSGAVDIPGILFRDYQAAAPGGNVSIQSTAPVFRAAAASSTGVVLGDALTIDAVVFSVVEIMPEDSGTIDFRLMLV